MSADTAVLVAALRELFTVPQRPEQLGRELWLACWMVGAMERAFVLVARVSHWEAFPFDLAAGWGGGTTLGEKIPPSSNSEDAA